MTRAKILGAVVVAATEAWKERSGGLPTSIILDLLTDPYAIHLRMEDRQGTFSPVFSWVCLEDAVDVAAIVGETVRTAWTDP